MSPQRSGAVIGSIFFMAAIVAARLKPNPLMINATFGFSVFLTKGRHPFKLRIPGFKKTLYGVFEVLLVNDETSAATFGAGESIQIFRDDQIKAAMKGRPVRFSLAYEGEKGKSVPVRYVLSLRKVK